ncbi:lytic transglycosylase domain-containing protein [Streptomyces sp. G-G2]|uniref:lytic transglycosylase domain-containing protein n=1 Tax=Streptomyces sp. G-G2 TaxID=3046201 RepID=UPI0024B98430|nr:lytic transglycosylase domain-containing protein [Streptomyces sp. G-G2]MDJ0381451.1 lytic transglycosylase domain-containing protein [Streptomyces sp. G-G2]
MKPLHRHLVSTSRKVLCTAALAASLTTAAVVTTAPTADAGEAEPGPDSPQANDRGNARLDLPDLVADPPPAGAGSPEGASGIPATALDAYRRAELSVAAALPNCKLPWQLLAGIGRIESVHASGYGLKGDGSTEKPIRGPRLDGNGFALIKDTDKGEWDGDQEYDRAVGPLQFIPETWKTWGADGSGDGKRDPNNIYDAALGAGLYLCAGDRDLSKPADLDKAILSYNSSREYVNSVLGWMRQYQAGVADVPNPAAGNYPTPPPGSPPTPPPPAPPLTPRPPATPAKPPTTPPTKPPTKPTEPTKPSVPPASVDGLTALGEPKITAEAGSVFATAPKVKAVLSDGKPAEGETVVFEIADDDTSGTVFAGAKRYVVVRTDKGGVATAPALTAGDKAGAKNGAFTLRATLYGTREFTVKFTATVTPKPAPVVDALARTTTKPLTAVAGSSFVGVEVKATAKDAPVAGTKITAALVEKDAKGAWVPVDPAAKTPFFKDKDGKLLHTVALAPTGADGAVVLPDLFTASAPGADAVSAAPGTYHLRLVTENGVELILDLIVTAAAPAPANSANPTVPAA